MSYIGKNPKVNTLNMTAQAALPTTPVEGMLWRSDGTVRGVGLFEYKNANWIQVDEQLGDADTLSLQSSDGVNLTYDANWYSSGSLNIQGRSDTWGAEREDLSGTGTNDFLSLSTTAADLLNSRGVSVIKFAPTDATAGRNAYFGIRRDLQQGWRGSNLVVDFRYKTNESTGDTTGTDWLFVARDASLPPLEISTQSTNTFVVSAIADVLAEDGTTSIYQAPVVGDSIMLTDTSNNTYIRYITVLSTAATSGSTPTVTYSGTDLTLPTSTTANATVIPGIFTSLTQYLPAADSEGKSYKAQVKTDTDTKAIEYGIMHISTQTDQQIYVDNILLSANKFLQASSRGKSECYFAKSQTLFWSTTGTTSVWDFDLLVAQAGSPLLAQSNLISIADDDSKTKITAKEDIAITVNITAYMAAENKMEIYDGNGDIIGVQQTQSSTINTYNQISATINLAKDGYIYTTTASKGNTTGAISITVEPQVNDVIILESQDEIFTSWVSYTPTGAYSTNVTYSGKWRRVGDTMEIRVMLEFTGVASGTMGVSIPSGYSVDLNKLARSSTNTKNKIGEFQYDAAGSYYYQGTVGVSATSGNVIGLGQVYMGDGTYIYTQNWSGTSGTGDVMQIQASFPVQGWTANFNPLLSMPLVDLGQPTEFWYHGWDSGVALWDGTSGQYLWDEALLRGPNLGNGVGNLANSNFITVSNITSGTNTVTAVQAKQDIILNMGMSGSLTAAQEIACYDTNDVSLFRQQQYGSTYHTSCSINVKLSAGDYIYWYAHLTHTYGNVWITATKPQTGNMAHIIKPAVAIIKDVKAYNADAGAATSGDWRTRDLNTIEGESWFVTLADPDFTLEPGTYKINATSPFYGATYYSSVRLYDVTNSSVVKYSAQTYAHTAQVNALIDAVLTIGASTAFRIQYRVQTTDADGLGLSNYLDSTAVSVYTTVRIEKLK